MLRRFACVEWAHVGFVVCTSRQAAIRRWQSGSARRKRTRAERIGLADVRFMKEKFPTVPVAIMMLTSDHRYGKGRVAGSFEAVGFAIRVPGSSWSEVFESEQWN